MDRRINTEELTGCVHIYFDKCSLNFVKLFFRFFGTGINHRFTWGVVLKQVNYLILVLPILFRSVDRIGNDRLNYYCRIFYHNS